MSTKTKIVLAAAAVLGATLAASAKNGGLPMIDIARTCHANTDALATSLGGEISANFDSCMADEKMAREEIIKNLASYPASAKSLCMQANQYLPSYTEWLVCLDMTQAVMKKREQDPAGTVDRSSASTTGSGANRQAAGRRSRPAHRECPIVKINQDGSLAWVDACPLGPPY
jgi:hypothetical protein